MYGLCRSSSKRPRTWLSIRKWKVALATGLFCRITYLPKQADISLLKTNWLFTTAVCDAVYDKAKPFGHTAFWDVDMQTLDYDKNARFVIEKVMNYGLLADIIEVLRVYGRERVKEAVMQAMYLKKKTLSFCRVIFDLTPDQFRCYTRQQSNPIPWTYGGN